MQEILKGSLPSPLLHCPEKVLIYSPKIPTIT